MCSKISKVNYEICSENTTQYRRSYNGFVLRSPI